MSDPPLIETFQRTVAERGLIRPGERLLVAVSGGPDSLALLHALRTLREALRIELVAAHLDHRMRGPEGEADAAFARATAEAWGIPVEIGARDVPMLASHCGLSASSASTPKMMLMTSKATEATHDNTELGRLPRMPNAARVRVLKGNPARTDRMEPYETYT